MPNQDLTYSQHFTAGAIAGSFEVIINHPLWVLKARIQSGYEPRWGLQGAYRGLLGNIGTMVPLIALRISTGITFQKYFYGTTVQPTYNQRITSALAGGAIVSVIVSPVEYMRTKQLTSQNGLIATTKNHIQQNGHSSLFKGILGTATRDALYTCGFFALAPILKEKLEPHCYKPWLASAISGPAAGVVAALTSQPFDTLKMYQQQIANNKKISIKEAAQKIITKDGYRGFFKGAGPRIARIISGVTVISTTNEKIINYFSNNKPKN